MAAEHPQRLARRPKDIAGILVPESHVCRRGRAIIAGPRRPHRNIKDTIGIHCPVPGMIGGPDGVHAVGILPIIERLPISPDLHPCVLEPEVWWTELSGIGEKSLSIVVGEAERPRTAKRFDAEGPVKFGPRPSFVGNAVRDGVFRLRGRR